MPLSPSDASALLEPFRGGFFYAPGATESMMRGIDMEAVTAVRGATKHRIAAAGGIATWTAIYELDAIGGDGRRHWDAAAHAAG